MTAKQFADKYQLWPTITVAASAILTEPFVTEILKKVSQIPVHKSRATRCLGMYVSKAGESISIRLQFAQEPDLLQQTFLHEIAHAFDHLSRKRSHNPYRRAHGPGWKNWALMLGIEAKSTGQSVALQALHQQRLKRVAVCRKCGTEFHRARRLNRNRTYIHHQCGGKLQTL